MAGRLKTEDRRQKTEDRSDEIPRSGNGRL